MFRRNADSFLGSVLLAAVVPLVLFSAIRSRIGLAWPRAKAQRPNPSRQASPSARPTAGEFQVDRALEAYEHLIDSVIAEKRA